MDALGSVHPTKRQLPSSEVAASQKLYAAGLVQPITGGMQTPFAFASGL